MTPERRLALLGPWPPPYGGVAVHVERLHELLRERGFKPSVLSFDVGVVTDDIHPLRHDAKHWPRSLATIARSVGRGGVLHNHTGLTTYPKRSILEPLFLMARLLQIRRLETLHDRTIVTRFGDFVDREKRLFVKAMIDAARIIAIGDDLRDFLVELGVAPTKVVVGQPLLPQREAPQQPPTESAAFFAAHSPVWITVGAFIPLYDFSTVARAFRRLLETEPAAGLIVVSGRFAVDRAYEDEVRSVLRQLGDRVVFMEDIPNPELRALLRSSSVLIRGPRYESYGLSRIEAVMAGTPVVATATGEQRSMTLYRHGDVDSLLVAAQEARSTSPETLQKAAAHYARLAEDSLQLILDVYEKLGFPGRAADVTR